MLLEIDSWNGNPKISFAIVRFAWCFFNLSKFVQNQCVWINVSSLSHVIIVQWPCLQSQSKIRCKLFRISIKNVDKMIQIWSSPGLWYIVLGFESCFIVQRSIQVLKNTGKYQQFVNGMQLHTQLQTGTGTWIYNLWKKTS